jgi:hypothetical protein
VAMNPPAEQIQQVATPAKPRLVSMVILPVLLSLIPHSMVGLDMAFGKRVVA